MSHTFQSSLFHSVRNEFLLYDKRRGFGIVHVKLHAKSSRKYRSIVGSTKHIGVSSLLLEWLFAAYRQSSEGTIHKLYVH